MNITKLRTKLIEIIDTIEAVDIGCGGGKLAQQDAEPTAVILEGAARELDDIVLKILKVKG